MKKIQYILLTVAIVIAQTGIWSCTDELDRVPLDKTRVTSETIYSKPESYKQALAKIYAGLSVTGQEGPAGKPDIQGIDEGFSSYLRQYWCAQELTTDLAIIAWNDGNLRDYHDQDWTAPNEFISAMYSRIFFQIQLANEFIRQTTDSRLSDRGVSEALKADIQVFRAEARFLRAYSYWHALDMFGGNVPFFTDANQLGEVPKQTNANDLFTYIESELLAIESTLAEPMSNEYGRVDKAAAWILLAKLYLNAEVYIGPKKYTESLTTLNKILNSGYELESEYAHLFLRDNNEASEIIFAASFDGNYTQSWGGMTFLVHATVGGTMAPADFGINSGWGGIRTTSAFVDKFRNNESEIDTLDSRALFHTDGQTLEINDVFEFTQGYAMGKFKNVDKLGEAGPNADFVDTDYPVFRLADAYLMYAEAVLRGGSGGDVATALNYVNAIRERAYGNTLHNITSAQLTLDYILDERARELYWEGHRRTDLIRYGMFSDTDYIWPWKGGVKDGIAVDSHFDIFPLPASDVNANPNLDQNPGY